MRVNVRTVVLTHTNVRCYQCIVLLFWLFSSLSVLFDDAFCLPCWRGRSTFATTVARLCGGGGRCNMMLS